MDKFFDPAYLQTLLTDSAGWLQHNVLVPSTAVQALVVVAAFFLSRLVAPKFWKWLDDCFDDDGVQRFVQPVVRAMIPLGMPVMWLVVQWFSVFAAEYAKWPHHLITTVVSLLTAWVVIRLASTLIKNKTWSRVIAGVAWFIAALSITGLLEPTSAVLDSMAIDAGDVHISVLGVIKAVLALGAFLWAAGALSTLVERQVSAMAGVTPAAGVLLGKLFRIAAYALAVVIGLETVGIDLTAFAVLSGAIGLGIGFGLQKIFSNLISGLILLMDRSVKPGDVIAIGTSYGYINSLGARCISVITRDGTEHLIPNEELISQRVENWSYSNRLVRLRMAIGISYDSDVHRAIELALQAAVEVDRVLAEPIPVCQLKGFGDNSVDLELRVWVNDPQNGLGNIRSEILLGVWDRFNKNGVEFPYPQRDIHVKSLPLEMLGAEIVTEDAPDASDGGAPEGSWPHRHGDDIANKDGTE